MNQPIQVPASTERPDPSESGKGQDRVCIIGGGPAGLATARVLKALHIPFDILERHCNVGGIWDASHPGSPMYQSAHFISSKTMSGHLGYPMPDHYPDYPSHHQILAYIHDFARHHELLPHVKFNTQVDQVAPEGEGWLVTCSGQPAVRYRWVVCASGTNWDPNVPQLPGQEKFKGLVRHSVSYHSAQELLDKRVLVVGAGNSGVDIACDAAAHADHAGISLRRGYHFIPKHIFGIPADVFGSGSGWLPVWIQQRTFGGLLRLMNGDLQRLGLPKPDHKLFESHPILNTQILHYLQHGDISAYPAIRQLHETTVEFVDGRQVAFDEIILATGYHWSLPYLSHTLFDWKQHRPKTYLKVFNPKHPTLFVNGFLETNGGAYKLLDEMALLIGYAIHSESLARTTGLRSAIASWANLTHILQEPPPDLSGHVHYVNSPRHEGYANSDALRKSMRLFRKRMGWEQDAESFFRRQKYFLKEMST